MLWNDVDTLGPWVWKRIGNPGWFAEGKSALGEVDGGKILWAVVFDQYNPGGSIHMHLAIDSPKYVTRRAIFTVFEYPFYQLGVKKVLATVNSTNHAALSFDLRLGFTVECVIEDAYDMGDMYVLSMTQEQCRWLRGKRDGYCEQSSAAA